MSGSESDVLGICYQHNPLVRDYQAPLDDFRSMCLAVAVVSEDKGALKTIRLSLKKPDPRAAIFSAESHVLLCSGSVMGC